LSQSGKGYQRVFAAKDLIEQRLAVARRESPPPPPPPPGSHGARGYDGPGGTQA
jgi:hypothetical protein